MSLDAFIALMLDPGEILLHIPYALLVVSMMMNDMGWLRAIAILAGVIRIINRAWFDIDPAIVFWESIFVLVNVVQLIVLFYFRKAHRFDVHERRFVETMPADVERQDIRNLLRLASVKSAEPGDVLTHEGEPVRELSFITDGVVQIEQQGKIVAVCGPGDYLGEMTFINGGVASATAIAAKPLKYLAFDQQRLRVALSGDGGMQRAMEATLNRNLIGKLQKSNAGRTSSG